MTNRLSSHVILLALLVILFLAFGSNLQQTRVDQSHNLDDLTERANRSLERATEWLIMQQGEDGGWHSETYGQLRGGEGETALALSCLAHLPQELRDRYSNQIQLAIRFLVLSRNESRTIRALDRDADYPIYAAALTLIALNRLDQEIWLEQKAELQKFLISRQRTGEQGWSADDLDYGGWGIDGDSQKPNAAAGKTNISTTSFALDALRASQGLTEEARNAAITYLKRCQNFSDEKNLDEKLFDGGFHFTPIHEDPLNKAGNLSLHSAGATTEHFHARSYGTTTADGISSMIMCGVASNDPRVAAAREWLRGRFSTSKIPGFDEKNHSENHRNSLRYYYRMSLARIMQKMPDAIPRKFRERLLRELLNEQREDGSWSNRHNVMKEDDPLVATPMAIFTISVLLDFEERK